MGYHPTLCAGNIFHGFADNRAATCPSGTADANGDGIIDLIETELTVGTTMVPFTDGPKKATRYEKQELAMLRSIEKLKDIGIIAADENVGTVEDVYFDDKQWVVRYLVVNTGGWLRGRRVLISPGAVQSIDRTGKTILAHLTHALVEGSPEMDTAKPVSRQQEAAYRRYYRYPPYESSMLPALRAMPIIAPLDLRTREEEEVARQQADERLAGADHHLRSSRVVLSYRIEASDDVIGRVTDFLFDEETWSMRYLIVDTRNWLHGKRVRISTRWIRAINRGERTLTVALKREEIEHSPEYDPECAPS